MSAESITVSVNYADYLELTLKYNSRHFSRCIVVTDNRDTETPKVCAHYPNVDCIKTDVFYRDGAVFCKSSGLNEALMFLQPKGWVVAWDADILIGPRLAGHLVDLDRLDRTHVYGPKHKAHIQRREIGSNLHDGGKACAGFFQLFSAPYLEAKAQLHYPTVSGNCSLDDVLFSKQFAGVYYLDETAYHLGPAMDDGIPNINWDGRKSPKCPLTVEDCERVCSI